ncbi:gdsl esterase/lipase [Quercus suber]|uniref:Gdsl esterase/lipase n=1 Tax=Quercus suber TaxID=58331 RepID=A0AAW0KEF8_QUESU
MEFGIKELLPAYRDPTLQPKDLLSGVNFASGGAGYDPLSSQLASAISLSEQLQDFKQYIGKLKGIVGEERTNFILAKSVVVVVAGCLPSQRTLFGGSEEECVKELNQASQVLNDKLSRELGYLNNNLPNANVVYIDIYNPLLDIITNPKKYGFEVANKSC